MVRAEVSRGVVMTRGISQREGLTPRAYVAALTLKNGVPINYIEAIGLCEWIEVGFNTFYTYRHGETAWIYAQVLRCLRQFTGATTLSGLSCTRLARTTMKLSDSGAFWFYRKLGFDPASCARGARPERRAEDCSRPQPSHLAECFEAYRGSSCVLRGSRRRQTCVAAIGRSGSLFDT